MVWSVCSTPPDTAFTSCSTPPSSVWTPCGAVLPPVGSKYAVTVPANAMAPGGSQTVTAQLTDSLGNPLSIANVVVNWSSTGGGSFAGPYSLTNASGIATVLFTGSAILYAMHTVTATDGAANTGTSLPFEESTDGMATIRILGEPPYAPATGGVLFLIDAISGSAGAAGFLTALTDLTRYGRAITIPSAPIWTPTQWNLTYPAMQFIATDGYYCTIVLPSIPQPFSIVSIISNYIGDANTGNDNIFNGGGAISYRIGTNQGWSLYAGTPVASSITSGNPSNANGYVRIDVFNGAASYVYRSNTKSTAINPGTGSIAAAAAGIGARNDGVDPSTMRLAGMFGINYALSDAQVAAIVSFYQARFAAIASS